MKKPSERLGEIITKKALQILKTNTKDEKLYLRAEMIDEFMCEVSDILDELYNFTNQPNQE